MHKNPCLRILRLSASLAAAALGCARLSADVVETKNGTRIVGKVTKVDAGSVYVTTDFAGDLTIKQSEVSSIATDGPLSVRLSDGTRIQGPISMQNGAMQVVGAAGTVSTSIPKVAAVWEAGGKDPQIAALERHWSYEASVDVEGTSGNKDQLGTSAGFRAKLVGLEDTLQYYTGYDRQVTSGVKSADQFKAGVDYAYNMSPDASWFVRDEGGYDRIMDIRFYDTAAAGVGYSILNSKEDVLTGRIGLGYRYDGYEDPKNPTINSAAADFEVSNDLKLSTSELVTHITAVPSLSDFSNYIVAQDTFYQIPLANPAWKLRMGVSNEYNSVPSAGFKKLDTTYYTRLILDWP
jgi:putative salt-induced outer membrane protein YdiY